MTNFNSNTVTMVSLILLLALTVVASQNPAVHNEDSEMNYALKFKEHVIMRKFIHDNYSAFESFLVRVFFLIF